MNFLSDNASSAHPKILEAVSAANATDNHGYGDEDVTRALNAQLCDLFEREVWAYPVITGTAANALIMATACPPHGAILCHSEAHLETDECGAPEFFSAGAKLKGVQGEHGKMTPGDVRTALSGYHDMVHMVVPSCFSITQSTELGRVYSAQEVTALCEAAKERGIFCHMDGARFANAVARLGCSPADITWRCGIDALSLGATKNGAMAAEVAIFFHEEHVRDFEFRRKRSGHLLSKQHFVSAQLSAYLADDLWLELANHANTMAQSIAHAAQERLRYPCDANEVFITLSDHEKEALRSAGFAFYDWGAAGEPLARIVTAWTTPQRDVDALCAALKTL